MSRRPEHNPIRQSRKTKMDNTLGVMKFMAGEEVKQKRKRKPRGKDKGPRQQPERELRKEVIKWLRKHGAEVWRVENSVYRQVGLPDLLFFHPSEGFFFCELKSNKGRLREEQKYFRDLCIRHKVNHVVIRSIDQLKDILEQ